MTTFGAGCRGQALPLRVADLTRSCAHCARCRETPPLSAPGAACTSAWKGRPASEACRPTARARCVALCGRRQRAACRGENQRTYWSLHCRRFAGLHRAHLLCSPAMRRTTCWVPIPSTGTLLATPLGRWPQTTRSTGARAAAPPPLAAGPAPLPLLLSPPLIRCPPLPWLLLLLLHQRSPQLPGASPPSPPA